MHIAIMFYKCQPIVEDESRNHNILCLSIGIMARNEQFNRAIMDGDIIQFSNVENVF